MFIQSTLEIKSTYSSVIFQKWNDRTFGTHMARTKFSYWMKRGWQNRISIAYGRPAILQYLTPSKGTAQ